MGVLLVVAVFAQGRAEVPSPWLAPITLKRIAERKEIEGYWALSSAWIPYMGLALELRSDGSFRFWFRSDVRVKGEPKYPVIGKYSIEGGILTLATSADIYDPRWVLISHAGRTGIFPLSNFDTIISRQESPHERMLFQIDDQIARKS